MVTVQLLSTGLMAVLLIAVIIGLRRLRAWESVRGDDSHASGFGSTAFDRLNSLATEPTVWAVTFVLGALILGLGVVAIVGDGLVEGVPVDILTLVIGAIVALVIVSYLFWGTYAATRNRGFGSAQAIGVGIGTLGLLFLLVIVLQLVVGLVG